MRELGAAPETESFDEFELRETGRSFQGFTKALISDGDYLGRVWTLREVTRERQIDRMKDALVATVSHELRTPLTSIIGYLELLGTGDEPLGDEDAKYADIVRRNAARLHHLVEELLFLARFDAGGLSLELATVDVGEAARDAISAAHPLAETKEISLNLESSSNGAARADAARIRQVLDNLLSNAIKFTPHGGRVSVSVGEEDGSCMVSVTDTGCGIPEDEQKRLFDRFFRSRTAAHIPGTGLGLTIVKAIVEGHGGSLSYRSVEGAGTTFTFSLPRPASAPRTAAAERAQARVA
jgi:signal transduction histidine kinase